MTVQSLISLAVLGLDGAHQQADQMLACMSTWK